MPWIDPTTHELNAKIVYFGPALAGKACNLMYIHARTDPAHRGPLLSQASEASRSLAFDLVPQTIAPIRGLRLRLHLQTVPGAIAYGPGHQEMLAGADGLVFVADSQSLLREANQEGMDILYKMLAANRIDPATLPRVLQYNKRDLTDILPLEVLDRDLNPGGRPRFEAVAVRGDGVFATLRACAGLVVERLRGEA